MKRMIQLTVACVVVLVIPNVTYADFMLAGQQNWSYSPFSEEIDVAIDSSSGTFYSLDRFDRFASYDASGTYLGAKSFSNSPGGDKRGIAFDANSGNLWVNDYYGYVSQITTSGTVLSAFNLGPWSYGITVDTSNDTLWVSKNSGVIRNVTKTGALISEFNTGLGYMSGITYDSVNNTLLAIRGANDDVFEFTKSGTSLGLVFSGNGFVPTGYNEYGLAFDATSGNLYVQAYTSNFAHILHDPDRVPVTVDPVPEPSTYAGLLGISCVSLLAYSWRKRLNVTP